MKVVLTTVCLLFACSLYAFPSKEIWTQLGVEGTLRDPWRYALSTDARFKKPYSENQEILLLAGVGYQATRSWSVWLGVRYVSTRGTDFIGEDRVNRLWQQVEYAPCHHWQTIAFRTRLEELNNTYDANHGTAVRLRQRVILRLPIFDVKKRLHLVGYDEIYFNLVHPEWVGNSKLLDQNRAFIGIGIRFNNVVSCDIGYLNQYELSDEGNQNNHIVSVNVQLNL